MMRLNPFKKASIPAAAKQPKASAAPFIEAGKLVSIAEAFVEIGLLEPKAFKSAVTSDSFYFGGSLEWSERASDMRFIVEGWAGGRVTRIYATPLRGAKNFLYGEELIASVNRRVQELLNA